MKLNEKNTFREIPIDTLEKVEGGQGFFSKVSKKVADFGDSVKGIVKGLMGQ
ncbi:ComC/BlpC family leader-containing pheromone/bacteriocin [Streptococcus pluranimalium]|uniref:ComC/BlpC family leader-containing pheromone/bacteriocin n=1 Tax=Streptococcus pluranimalium TaxID=82348 RepID=UPI002AAD3EB2|nr:ComC/BlpC family leader-containing pheromone/bacteriocin [Streptococcus suis]HEM6117508.1 ComC/BlpC family leader-containing pheromone/bacteriocin [Streptococcus suis]